MDHFTYSWRDFAKCYRVALAPRAILTGTLLALCTVGELWLVTALGLLDLSAVTGCAHKNLELSRFATCGLLALSLSLWWFAFSLFSLANMRMTAAELCSDTPHTIKAVRAWTFAHLRGLVLLPATMLFPALVLLIPLVLWALVALIPSVGAWVAGLSAPLAIMAASVLVLYTALTLLASPLMAASLAVNSGDSFDALSRGAMYGAMAPQRLCLWLGVKLFNGALAAALALVVYAGTACLLCVLCGLIHGQATGWELYRTLTCETPLTAATSGLVRIMAIGIWISGLFVAGYWIAFMTAADVALYILMRHWCDGTPRSEFTTPRRAFERTTAMEKTAAQGGSEQGSAS